MTVTLSEEVARKEFDGLSLYDSHNKLIDPCCGTGSFLEELLKSSLESKEEPAVIGFEVLPGPYALAHYRMSMVSDEYPENLKIVLTNTLSDDLEQETTGEPTANLISEEQAIARQLAKPPLTLIIGNPPSSDSQNHSNGEGFQIIQGLLDDFRPPTEQRTARQNIQKQLQNEFVKFLRWSSNKLMGTEIGILAFILPSSFVENGSYIHARKWIYNHFSKFWILDIDLDARTGVRSSSLFNTLQGRLLLIALKDKENNAENKTAYYKDISNLKRQEKMEIMRALRISDSPLDEFDSFEIEKTNYVFRPQKNFDKETYGKFWDLYSESSTGSYVFQRHCSGIKLAPSSLFVHALKPLLVRRSAQIADNNIDVSDIIRNWYTGQDRVPSASKFTVNVRRHISTALAKANHSITEYAFRPFLTIPALISETVLQELARASGGGTRYRPEVLSAFASTETVGIAIAPSTKDLSNKLHRFASFCWNLPDNDLCKRGNAHVFCNQFPQYRKSGKEWNSQPVNNINQSLIDRLETTPTDLVFYVYGILCSDRYLDEFEGALFAVSSTDQWPKIPITADRQLFNEIAAIGKSLAELEKPPTENIILREPYLSYESLYKQEFNLNSFKIDPEEESVSMTDNSNIELKSMPVPKEILEFQVSGYQVIYQWLKVHSHRYTRTTFTKQQFTEFLFLLQRIGDHMVQTRKIDDRIGGLLQGEDLLI